MKLSERLQGTGAWAELAESARALEADLEAAYQANRDPTARADRLRHWHDSFRELADALDLPSHLSATEVIEEAKVRRSDMQEELDAALYAERCAREATAVLHLVYEMREHALRREWQRALSVSDYERDMAIAVAGKALAKSDRGVSRDLFYAGIAAVHFFDLARIQSTESCGGLCVISNLFDDERHEHETCRKFFDATVDRDAATDARRRLNRRAQAAESRATKLAREVATLRVRLQGAIAKIPPGDLWRTPDPAVDAAAESPVTKARLDHACRPWDATRRARAVSVTEILGDGAMDSTTPNGAIPPVALEASDGGNRQAETAERPFPVGEQCMFVRSRSLDGSRQTELVRVLSYDDVRNRVLVVMHGGTRFQCEGYVRPDDLEPDTMSDEDIEDLARRRVTERAEFDLSAERIASLLSDDEPISAGIATLEFEADIARQAIAERDARIARLKATHDEVDAALQASGVHRSDIRTFAEMIADIAAERDEAVARAERAERERDNTCAAMLMVGGELCADPKIDPEDTGDPRWTPTLQEARALRVRAERAEAVIAKALRRCRTISNDASLAHDLIVIFADRSET